MHWTGWLIVALALAGGGWLLFDGSHAFMTGDYVTPSAGEHAGRLGPWADIVSAVGLEPRSTFIKGAHVALGSAWLLSAAGLVWGAGWARGTIAGCAVASLWYVPGGVALAVVELGLLLLSARGGS